MASSAAAYRTRDVPHGGAAQPPRRALLAAVTAAVLAREASSLGDRAEDLAPLAVLEDDLVAASVDLERSAHLLESVKLHRPRLVEVLEVGGVHEVAHRNPVDTEAQRLDRIGALVGIDRPG